MKKKKRIVRTVKVKTIVKRNPEIAPNPVINSKQNENANFRVEPGKGTTHKFKARDLASIEEVIEKSKSDLLKMKRDLKARFMRK